MTHRVESIVAAVVSKVTGLTTTASRVYRGRVYPIGATELPCLLVYQGGERLLQEFSYDQHDWELTIFIEARVKSPTAQVETTLNTIREQVAVALGANHTQGLDYVINTREAEHDAPDLSGESDQVNGAQRSAWLVHFRRSRTNPGA